MKAVVFDQPGNPASVLSLRDVPTPTPKRGEVRVRMLASPINPSDLLYIEGRYTVPAKLPATPGFEGVGVVEQSGGGLLGWFMKGRRVVVLNDRNGNWSEQTIASAKLVILVPASLTDEQAAMFFVNPATALAITRYVLAVPPGGWLLQSAAGSALGKMVIRLSKHFGFRTINIVRRREQFEELLQLGADHVFLDSDPFLEQLPAITGQNGVLYAMDAVGGMTGAKILQALAPGGNAVLYGLLSGEPIALDPRLLITGSKSVQGFWLGDWMKQHRLLKKLRVLREVRQLLQAGVLKSEIGASFPLERVQEAVKLAATPGKSGKVLLQISQSAR